MEEKKAYSQPTIIEYGDVAEITQASTVGRTTDATFPAGTPLTDLTFS